MWAGHTAPGTAIIMTTAGNQASKHELPPMDHAEPSASIAFRSIKTTYDWTHVWNKTEKLLPGAVAEVDDRLFFFSISFVFHSGLRRRCHKRCRKRCCVERSTGRSFQGR